MPLLESLSLSFGEPPHWQRASLEPILTFPWQAKGILGCERLTSLRVSAIADDIPWDTVKWEQLTTFVLDSTGDESGWGPPARPIVRHMKRALRRATALISCTLHAGRRDWLGESTVTEEEDQPIELPFLKHLCIEEDEGVSLLALLRAPSFRSLSYCNNRDINLERSPLLRFLNSNIGIEVEEFVTNTDSMVGKDLVNCLRLCPALRLLHVNSPPPYGPEWASKPVYNPNCPLSNELLTLFTPPSVLDTDEILCPKLEDIEFLAHEAKFSEAEIVKFIERKQNIEENKSLCKLRTIKVAFSKMNRGDKDIMADLQQYTDTGLQVEFRYHPVDPTGSLSLYDGLHLE